MSKAYFSSPTGKLSVYVKSYSTAISSNIQNAQTRDGIMNYPVKVGQTNLKVSIQTTSVGDYERIQLWLRKRQRESVLYGYAVQFTYPSQNIDWYGFINYVPMAHNRFDFAPVIDLDMLLVKDMINVETKLFSSSTGNIEDIYNGDVDGDEIAAEPPVTITDPSALPAQPAPAPTPVQKVADDISKYYGF